MIEGYNLIRSDYPSNIKRGAVCIYFKESLAVRIVNITSLTECLVCEVQYKTKKNMVLLCRDLLVKAPLNYLLLSFFSDLEDLLSNILCSKSQFSIILGDLNEKSPEWWSEDIATFHSMQIDSLTTKHVFKQLISDPTHILPQSSSCIDLIFSDQPNYVIGYGTHPSLHPNCHHQIIFCKLNVSLSASC